MRRDLIERLRGSVADADGDIADALVDAQTTGENVDTDDWHVEVPVNWLRQCIAALEAEASEGERLRAAIREALACFEAAAAEGMADRVAEAREADGFDPASVAGLFERRVAFAIPALERALIPEAPAREGWQPIETAPKDKAILIYDQGQGRCIAYWAEWHDNLAGEDKEGWRTMGDFGRLDWVTHWMPIPGPPQDHREG